MNSIKAMAKSSAKMSRKKPGLGEAARQLGLDRSQFGDQGEEIWAMLNEMAEKDPEAYKTFIEEQLEQAKKGEKALASSRKRGFRPERGMAIETELVHKLSDSGKVFINLCSFEGIEAPLDAAGVTVTGRAKVNLSGLSIPIAVSPFREYLCPRGEPSFVLDAVFHPWVMEQAKEFSSFQAQVFELALTWCESELHGKLSRKYTILGEDYVDLDNNKEAFFEVKCEEDEKKEEEQQAMSDAASQEKESDVIQDPTVLLSALRESHNETGDSGSGSQSTDAVSTLLGQDKSPPAKRSGALVTELDSSRRLAKGNKGQQNKVVKKGFLHNASVELYPEGTKEGQPTSMYQKSKIVDLSKLSNDEVKQVMMEHASADVSSVPTGPKPVKAAPQPKENNAKKTSSVPKSTQAMVENAIKSISQTEKDTILHLLEEADDELAKSSRKDASENLQEDALGLLGDMAKALGMFEGTLSEPSGSSAFSATVLPATKSGASNARATQASSEKPTPTYTIEEKVKGSLKVTVKLPLVSSLADVDVDVSDFKVRLVCKAYTDTTIRLPTRIDQNSARAKFNKKTGKLTISANTEQS